MCASGIRIEQFDWIHFLTLAKFLAEKPIQNVEDSARFRTIVNRAYYAVHGKARRFLVDREGKDIPHTGEAHRIVYEEFQNKPDKTFRKIGLNLQRLFGDRFKVDYRDWIDDDLQKMVTTDLKIADEIIEKLNSLFR